MTRIDDLRRTIESTLGTLTPAKAQQLAKGLLEPGARKDQVAKTAGDLIEWSQKNRQKIRNLVRSEIREQLEQVGVASRADLDALKKRVRELERQAGLTASGRKKATASTAKATERKRTAGRTAVKPARPSSAAASAAASAKRKPTGRS